MAKRPPRTPLQRELDWRRSVEERLTRLEQMEALVISFVDDSTNVERLRLGQHDDGSWGYTIFNADGTIAQQATF